MALLQVKKTVKKKGNDIKIYNIKIKMYKKSIKVLKKSTRKTSTRSKRVYGNIERLYWTDDKYIEEHIIIEAIGVRSILLEGLLDINWGAL